MIGIIGAMEEETRILLKEMTERTEEQVHHLTCTRGKIGKQEVVLVQSGIGKVNSALATAFLVDRYRPDLIINTGSAGAIRSGLQVGDMVIATELAYHDVDATAFGYQKGQVPQMPATYTSDAEAVTAIEKAAREVGLRPSTGVIVSSDSFVASKEEVERIRAEFPEAVATEMEGASIAQASMVLGTPFVVVRAISDSSDEDAGVTFDEFIVTAGKKSAEMVLAFLRHLAA